MDFEKNLIYFVNLNLLPKEYLCKKYLQFEMFFSQIIFVLCQSYKFK
jgi:hypothetical protein